MTRTWFECSNNKIVRQVVQRVQCKTNDMEKYEENIETKAPAND